MLKAEMKKVLDRCAEIGPDAAMKEHEAAHGHEVLTPDTAPWIRPEDWENYIITRDGERIRLVVLMAARPRSGALGRLVTGICKAGLIPVVVIPLGFMEAILRRWGWRREIVGSTFDDLEEHWTPSVAWMLHRAAR